MKECVLYLGQEERLINRYQGINIEDIRYIDTGRKIINTDRYHSRYKAVS